MHVLIRKKNFLTNTLKEFTLDSLRMYSGREFHMPITL